MQAAINCCVGVETDSTGSALLVPLCEMQTSRTAWWRLAALTACLALASPEPRSGAAAPREAARRRPAAASSWWWSHLRRRLGADESESDADDDATLEPVDPACVGGFAWLNMTWWNLTAPPSGAPTASAAPTRNDAPTAVPSAASPLLFFSRLCVCTAAPSAASVSWFLVSRARPECLAFLGR